MRKLVSIQRVESLHPIEGADFVQYAQLENLAWTLVVSKDHFSVSGETCIFFEIDSIIPGYECLSFLPASARNKRGEVHVKTRKFKGQYSQGLALPIRFLDDIITEHLATLNTEEALDLNLKIAALPEYYQGIIDLEVTELLGVTKYEPPVKGAGGAPSKSTFPSHLLDKTDETRIQSSARLLQNMHGLPCIETVKMDGTSYTHIVMEGETLVCSRNQTLDYDILDDTNAYKIPELRYGLTDELQGIYERMATQYPEVQGVAIQGELCGPGIQRNLLQLDQHELFVFNLIFLGNGGVRLYADYFEMADILYGIVPVVPINEGAYTFIYDGEYRTTVNNLLKKAEGKYNCTKNQREGLVFREIGFGIRNIAPASFKVVSNRYLQKEAEWISKNN